MGISTNIFRRKGRYWFRMRVPADMMQRVGRREIWRSLGTADPALARRRAARVADTAFSLWQRVRADMSLTKQQIDELVVGYFHEILESDARWRIADKPSLGWRDDPLLNAALKVPYMTGGEDGILKPTDEAMAEHIRRTGKAEFDVFADGFAHITRVCTETALSINDWADAKTVAELVLANAGRDEPYGSPAYRMLCMGLLRAMHEASKIMLARSAGDYSVGPSDALFKTAAVHAPQSAPGRTIPNSSPPLRDLVEQMLSEKSGITAKFKDDYRAAITAFEQTLHDARSWTKATRREVAQFKDLLLQTPTNWTKHYRGKPLPEVVKLAKKDGRPRLSTRTVNDKYLALLSTVLRFAVNNGYIDQNPAQGLKAGSGGKAARPEVRAPFQADQLRVLFAAPMFTGCLSAARFTQIGNYRIRDHRFWTPLIGLFSGARLNEIGQLRRQDVAQLDDIWCFRITDEGDEGHRLKTDAAKRTVPIHAELQRLGFIDYVALAAPGEADRIFPSWSKGADGYYSSVMSKSFGRLLGSVGLTDRKLVFHSFRHTFIDALRAARVEKSIRAALVGHEDGSVESLYGHGYPTEVLYEAVKAVRYDGLDLSTLA